MTLEDCTKDELICFIKNECLCDLDRLEFDVLMCRSEKALKAEGEENEKADAALSKYAELVKPYEGKKLSDVPDEIIRKVTACFELYEKHTRSSNAYGRKWKEIQKQIDKNYAEG